MSSRFPSLAHRYREASILLVCLFTLLLMSVATAALLSAAGQERLAAVRNETASRLDYIAFAGISVGFARLAVASDVSATWNGWLTTKDVVNEMYAPDENAQRYQLYVTVADNDDGDGDPMVDADGIVVLTSAAFGPDGDAAAVQLQVLRRRFDQFLFAIGSGNFAATAGMILNGPLFVNGELRIVGDPVTFSDDVQTVGGEKIMSGAADPTYAGRLDEGVAPIVFPTITDSQFAEMKAAAISNHRFYSDGKDRLLQFGTPSAGLVRVRYYQNGTGWVFEEDIDQTTIEIFYAECGSISVQGEVGSPSGTVRVSVLTEADDIIINGNLTYTDIETDVLGLITPYDILLETSSGASNRGFMLGNNTYIAAALFAGGTMKVTAAGASFTGYTSFGSMSLGALQAGDTTGIESVWSQPGNEQQYLFDPFLSEKSAPYLPKVPNAAPIPYGMWQRLLPGELPTQPSLPAP